MQEKLRNETKISLMIMQLNDEIMTKMMLNDTNLAKFSPRSKMLKPTKCTTVSKYCFIEQVTYLSANPRPIKLKMLSSNLEI